MPRLRKAFLISFAALVVLAPAACGGDGEEAATSPAGTEIPATEPAPTETATVPTETAEAPPGDPEQGSELFASAGCDGCHTYGPAGSTAEIGPSLDDVEQREAVVDQPLPEYVRESILEPDAVVVEGFQSGVMPDYSDQLTDEQVEDLVAFLLEPSG